MPIVSIKRNDTARTIVDRLMVGAVPLDLTGCTVALKFSAAESGVTVTRSATVTDALSGRVSYAFIDADVAEAGFYHLEWLVTYANGKKLTVPTIGCAELEIRPDL
jgi:hypothetical protein